MDDRLAGRAEMSEIKSGMITEEILRLVRVMQGLAGLG